MASRDPRGVVVLLSGPVGAGKTTLANTLVAKLGLERLFTRDAILRRLPSTPRTRVDLQAAGERLDRETNGVWVADELRELIASDRAALGVVVDAALIPEQVEAIRRASQGPVLHVHLTAPLHELEERYSRKGGGIAEAEHYSELLSSSTEANVDQLAESADLVIDTSVTPVAHEVESVRRRLDEMHG